jgi:hypothetical protein|nr:MAG TPA: hypothetical protein [Caudoviricetes sp.]
MSTLKKITKNKTELEKLKELSLILAESIDNGLPPKELSGIAKQYRETILEIERLEGVTSGEDEISEIIEERKAKGKSGSVR